MTHFIVGPTELYKEVKDTLKENYTYFRCDDFSKLTKKCMNEIQELLGNSCNNSTFHLASSGTGAMEAVAINCANKNDKVLVINGGNFGNRFCEILKLHNINYDEINLEWNEVITKEHFEKYNNKGYTLLFVNLHETTYGKLYDINLISDFCKKNNIMLIVDAIGTFLADEYNMDKFNIDASIISSQKGLCLSPGMAIVSLSKRMKEKIQQEKQINSYYFNFIDYINNIERGQTPFTPSVFIMYELNSMLELIKKTGGKENWIKEINKKALYFRKKALENNLTVPNYPKSNLLTPVIFNKNNAVEIVKELKENYNIFVNPCGGEFAQKMIRIAHIGNLTIEDHENLIEKIIYIKERI